MWAVTTVSDWWVGVVSHIYVHKSIMKGCQAQAMCVQDESEPGILLKTRSVYIFCYKFRKNQMVSLALISDTK